MPSYRKDHVRHVAILRDALQSRNSILIASHIRQRLWSVLFYPRQGPAHNESTLLSAPRNVKRDCQAIFQLFLVKIRASWADRINTSFACGNMLRTGAFLGFYIAPAAIFPRLPATVYGVRRWTARLRPRLRLRLRLRLLFNHSPDSDSDGHGFCFVF